MPVSRKRKIVKKNKSSKKKYKPYEAVTQNLYRIDNPFQEEISFEQRIKPFLELAERSTIEFEIEFQKLQEYFKDYDPLYLCSFCVFYFIAEKEGIDKEAIDGRLDFHMFYLEILQCYSLYQERTLSAMPLNEKEEDFKKLLQDLNQHQSFAYFKLSNKATTEEEFGPVMLRLEMMHNTLAVRNWAYEGQMQKIAYELSARISAKFEDKLGFKPEVFLDVLFGLADLSTKKLNAHKNNIRPAIIAKNFNAVFDAYENNMPGVSPTNALSRLNLWEEFGKNLQMLKSFFIEHSDLKLKDIFTIDFEEIKALTNISLSNEDISRIFDPLAYRFGDLSNEDKNHVFLNNPIHSKPFIRLDENKYFSAVPFLFSHLGIDLLEGFIMKEKTLKDVYIKEKGKYLEEKIEKLFKDAFPDAKIFSGSLWTCPTTNKIFENDLIVLIEDFAIIVEAKSGTVSNPAKRGAPERLFQTLKDLVVAPSEQAIRFKNYLQNNKKLHIFKTKSGAKNELDSNLINYYVPLGVTLSNLGSIGCNLKKLIEAKVVTHKLEELAPSISFTDLEVIFDILPLQSEKVHYLSRRREFEAHVNFQGDELDLFGFYLKNGFNIGEDEYNNSTYLNLTLLSKELDPYMIGKGRGIQVKKPFLQKTQYWSDTLNYINSNGNNWLVASFILLNLPKQDQALFEKKLNELKSSIVRGKMSKPHNWVSLTCGPERRQYAIVGYPYKDIDTATRNNVLDQILELESKNNLRGVVVLGYNLNNPNYPYSFIAGNLETNLFDKLDLADN